MPGLHLYLCVVILKNRYMHLHAVSRLAGTNCTHKPVTIEAANVHIECVVCKTIKSQQLAYQLDFQFISTFSCIGMMHVNLHNTCYNILCNILAVSMAFWNSDEWCVLLQFRYSTFMAVWLASTTPIYIYMP